jgi:hypothetical protein
MRHYVLAEVAIPRSPPHSLQPTRPIRLRSDMRYISRLRSRLHHHLPLPQPPQIVHHPFNVYLQLLRPSLFLLFRRQINFSRCILQGWPQVRRPGGVLRRRRFQLVVRLPRRRILCPFFLHSFVRHPSRSANYRPFAPDFLALSGSDHVTQHHRLPLQQPHSLQVPVVARTVRRGAVPRHVVDVLRAASMGALQEERSGLS